MRTHTYIHTYKERKKERNIHTYIHTYTPSLSLSLSLTYTYSHTHALPRYALHQRIPHTKVRTNVHDKHPSCNSASAPIISPNTPVITVQHACTILSKADNTYVHPFTPSATGASGRLCPCFDGPTCICVPPFSRVESNAGQEYMVARAADRRGHAGFSHTRGTTGRLLRQDF